MKITYKNFEIEVGEYSFDLYQTRPPKQFHRVRDENRDIKVCHGYFNKLNNAIKSLIQIELSIQEEIVDLRSFLELYRSIYDDILNTINTQSCNQ